MLKYLAKREPQAARMRLHTKVRCTYSSIVATTLNLLQLNGQKPEWTSPQISVGNCPNITKMQWGMYTLV